MPLTKSIRIAAFLRTHAGFWCKKCLHKAIGGPEERINVLTNTLSKNRKYYLVELVYCDGCGARSQCIRFVEDQKRKAKRL